MVVLSQPIVDNLAQFKTCKPAPDIFTGIPVVDFSDPNAKARVVEACKEFGFFKLINHGVSMELFNLLEAEAVKFFKLPQQEKEKSGPPSPFGYGNKRIGPNGDVGWVEYLLFSTTTNSHNPNPIFPGIPQTLWCLVNEYVSAVRNMGCEVLEMIAEELQMGAKDVLSRLIRDEKSDSCFRLNHYPPCPELQALSGRNLIGFGEHTDPQIISVLRSNNTSGLQICLKDGSWVSVPSDHTSFYMLAIPYRSVKHRVLADSLKSRVSMIYFGGPGLSERIRPLSSVMEDGEESLYKEFTWCEYKKSAYKSRLGDNRLSLFQKSAAQ
ncbi:UNVERIFIED_CONTAM: Gibberellin 2-beta-dioxygenase [Sesamum latifolium]|uniref:gibberellin 2beta-dioxygenase n=1 Tax=Sesamum latifolium TaxID=2727402 RepID=A0AAW2TTE4_9LAMI